MRLALVAAATMVSATVAGSQRPASQDAATNQTLALRNTVLSRELFMKQRPSTPGVIRAIVYDWRLSSGAAIPVTFEDGTTVSARVRAVRIIGAGKYDSVRGRMDTRTSEPDRRLMNCVRALRRRDSRPR